MNRQKTAALLLAGLVTLPVLSACTGKKDPVPGNQGGDTSMMNETGYPIVNDPITLKIASYTADYHEDGFAGIEMIERWENETGIKLEFDTVPQSAWETRKSLIFTSGDIPDLICTNAGLSNDDIITFADQKLIVPLEELIENYGENLNAILEENPMYRPGMVTPDGHIYSYPALADIDFGNRGGVVYLNKQWLDEIGVSLEIEQGEYINYLKNPLTTEEFKDILVQFKQRYPDNYPYTSDGGSESFLEFYASFGAQDNGDHLISENGAVSYSAVNPNLKEGIKWVHSLYNEGLIDPEVFTQDQSMQISKLQMEPYSAGATKIWTIQQAFDMSDERYQDWVLIPPLTAPDGTTEWTESVPGVINGFGVITTSNPYPEVSARLMDYFYSEYNSVDLMIGPIGSAVIQNEAGQYVQQEVPEGKTHTEWVGMKNPGCMPFLCPPSVTDRCVFNEAVSMTVEVGQVYRPYQVQKNLPSLLLGSADKQTVADFKANANDFIVRKHAEWIQNGTIDSEWDSYVSELEKMGYQEYVEIYQKAYDAAIK